MLLFTTMRVEKGWGERAHSVTDGWAAVGSIEQTFSPEGSYWCKLPVSRLACLWKCVKTWNSKPAWLCYLVCACRNQGKVSHWIRPTFLSFENSLAFKKTLLTLLFWNRNNLEVLHSAKFLPELLHLELAAQDFDEPGPRERSSPAAEYSV